MPELTRARIIERLEQKEQEKKARIPTKYRRSEKENEDFAIDRDKIPIEYFNKP